MASGQRPGERVVHQDYIARIRYQNDLPPPANNPKLLDIPGTGLAGGQYTGWQYASKLARVQPLNIEADAELGMPLDLIGIPGVFDGDESAISARPGAQVTHPTDKLLLKPLSALGKGAGGPVSFLRRTEYTSSQGPQHYGSAASKDLTRVRNDPKRRKISSSKEDPLNIIRHIVKGFDLAYPEDAYSGEENTSNIRGAAISEAEANAWSIPKHPSKPELTLLDSYPVLPDLDAIPTSEWYMVAKFVKNPVAAGDHYDERLNVAVLRPKEDKQAYAQYQQKLAEWDASSDKPKPFPADHYDYYLPVDHGAVRGIKRKFDINDPENDDEELYTDEAGTGSKVFRYSRIRTYETYNQSGNANNFYDDSVALALHDPDTEVGDVPGVAKRLVKGAYYYPVAQRVALRQKTVKTVGGVVMMSQANDDVLTVDEIALTIGNLTADEESKALEIRAGMDGTMREDGVDGLEDDA